MGLHEQAGDTTQLPGATQQIVSCARESMLMWRAFFHSQPVAHFASEVQLMEAKRDRMDCIPVSSLPPYEYTQCLPPHPITEGSVNSLSIIEWGPTFAGPSYPWQRPRVLDVVCMLRPNTF